MRPRECNHNGVPIAGIGTARKTAFGVGDWGSQTWLMGVCFTTGWVAGSNWVAGSLWAARLPFWQQYGRLIVGVSARYITGPNALALTWPPQLS